LHVKVCVHVAFCKFEEDVGAEHERSWRRSI
jgi:hypothetical protein